MRALGSADVSSPPRPGPLGRLAGRLSLAEGVGLIVLSLGYGISLLVGAPHNRGLALFGAGLGVLFGAGLALAGRGLQRGRRGAWSPAFVAQILLTPVGIGLVQSGQPVAAVLVLVPALVTGALLLLSPPRPGEG